MFERKKKVFITGCGGMLGQAVYNTFSDKFEVLATDIDLNEDWLEFMDVKDYKQCFEKISKFRPDIILHLAALTNLEFCEKNPGDAKATNALGTKNIALISKKVGALMVYIGTAGIFDGKKEYYNELDTPRPLSVYGKYKLEGERFIQKNMGKFFIFRAGWMMGGGPKKDKKFVNKIYKQIKEGKKEIFVVNDKLGTPTYTLDFAKNMLKVIESKNYGLYHMVCQGSCSRYDVVKEFLKYLNLQDKIKLKIVGSDFFQKEYFAPRPASEKLINHKLGEKGMNLMREWKDCLKEYSKEFKIDLSKTI
ncbi:SDR family oxidoreductase [candidate division KSB1 bacterium]